MKFSKLSLVTSLRTKPTRFFTKKMWTNTVKILNNYGFSITDLMELYYQHCRFKFYFIGGVIIDDSIRKLTLSHFDLADMFLQLFPVFEMCEVLRVLNDENRICLVCKTEKHPQADDSSFTIVVNACSLKFAEAKTIMQGESIVFKYCGSDREIKRVHPSLVCRLCSHEISIYKAKVESLTNYRLAMDDNDDLFGDIQNAKDAVSKALQENKRNIFALNFCDFAERYFYFLTLTQAETLAFACNEMYHLRLVEMIPLLHRDRNTVDILALLVNTLREKSTEWKCERKIITNFPAVLYPLLLLQKCLARAVRARIPTDIFRPISFIDAWNTTVLSLYSYCDEAKTCRPQHVLRQEHNKLCMICRGHTNRDRSAFCKVCLVKAASVFVKFGGYKFSKGILKKVVHEYVLFPR